MLFKQRYSLFRLAVRDKFRFQVNFISFSRVKPKLVFGFRNQKQKQVSYSNPMLFIYRKYTKNINLVFRVQKLQSILQILKISKIRLYIKEAKLLNKKGINFFFYSQTIERLDSRVMIQERNLQAFGKKYSGEEVTSTQSLSRQKQDQFNYQRSSNSFKIDKKQKITSDMVDQEKTKKKRQELRKENGYDKKWKLTIKFVRLGKSTEYRSLQPVQLDSLDVSKPMQHMKLTQEVQRGTRLCLTSHGFSIVTNQEAENHYSEEQVQRTASYLFPQYSSLA